MHGIGQERACEQAGEEGILGGVDQRDHRAEVSRLGQSRWPTAQLLPNAIHAERYGPGAKNPVLLRATGWRAGRC